MAFLIIKHYLLNYFIAVNERVYSAEYVRGRVAVSHVWHLRFCVCVSAVRQGRCGQRWGDAAGLRDGELHQPVRNQKDQLEHWLQGAEPATGFGEGRDGADGGAAGYTGHYPSGNGE